ncbi:unnamed protein product [Rhizoctonia solani]|uniref:Uncharacterized protein n=1 Tax=Rhizoctonia solani TaxID=456999 RepID=A0A8H3DBP8_9AGAM|nr:unnamed protein product [Rhizoctonia solani]
MNNMSRADGLLKLALAAADLAKSAAVLSEAAQIVASMFSSEPDNAPSGSLEGGIVSKNSLGEPVIESCDAMINLEPSPIARVSDQLETHTSTDGGSIKPYRILLEQETDILVYACALIQNSNRTICYTHHSVSALELYATLFRAIHPKLVYTIENTTQGELDRACNSFISANSSVLLLPETVYPNVELSGSDSWVIHVGWPVDMLTYMQHIRDHKAFNNVFIAQTDDSRNHASVADLIEQSIPWPGDLDSVEQRASSLQASFKQKLLEVPHEIKEIAYLDYIACHGPHGHRNSSWSANSLAYSANRYILDVLQYINPESEGTEGMGVDFSLPEISPEFVKHHDLDQAVRAGVIRIKEIDSGLNHLSSLPEDARSPIETVVPSEINAPSGHLPESGLLQEVSNLDSHFPEPRIGAQRQDDSQPLSSSDIMNTGVEDSSLGFNPTNNTQLQADSRDTLSQPSLVRDYLIIEVEFDIIPTICHLARREYISNVICFVRCLDTTGTLIELMKEVISRPIYAVRDGIPISMAIKKSLQSPSGCLLLCDMSLKVHPELRSRPFDLVIHIGWPEKDSIYIDHTQLPGLQKNNIILSRKEVNGSSESLLLSELHRMGLSAVNPATKRDFNRQTGQSIIKTERLVWRNALASTLATACVRSYYMAWITRHFSGSHKRQGWTSIDVVNQANKHIKEVLLHGHGKQGNPVRGRPSVTMGYVSNLKLENAVTVGILTVRIDA